MSAKKSTEEFIEQCKKNHEDYIDYSLVQYTNSHEKIELICHKKDDDGNEHGIFMQIAYKHLQGQSCPICALEANKTKHLKTTASDFKIKGNIVHDGKYDYSLVNEKTYKGIKTKVDIICPIHGLFKQTPYKHVNCKQGCPKCNSSKLEASTRKILASNKIEFQEQKHFEWLGLQTLDFYLPKYNIAIECQGMQHFTPRDFAYKGKEWADILFRRTIYRDKIKHNLCNENGVKLLYIIEDLSYINLLNDKSIYNSDIVFKNANDIIPIL